MRRPVSCQCLTVLNGFYSVSTNGPFQTIDQVVAEECLNVLVYCVLRVPTPSAYNLFEVNVANTHEQLPVGINPTEDISCRKQQTEIDKLPTPSSVRSLQQSKTTQIVHRRSMSNLQVMYGQLLTNPKHVLGRKMLHSSIFSVWCIRTIFIFYENKSE